MNVVHLAGSLGRRGGGIPGSVLPLAQALASDEVSAAVFSTDTGDEGGPSFAPATVRHFPRIGPRKFDYCPGMLAELMKNPPDIVHAHGLWTYLSIAAQRWKRRTGGRRVVSVHGMLNAAALNVASWKKRIALRLYERRHLEDADCIHAVSEAEREAIRKFGLKNPVAVVPNAVVLPATRTLDCAPDWASTVPAGRRVLLYLGRFHPIKGLLELLAGWHASQRHDGSAGWVLVVAGWDDAGLLPAMQDYVKEMNLEESVTFAGPQFGACKVASLQAADAFVLPSTSEGLPVAVLEAWGFELPVLMSSHCNLDIGFVRKAALRADPNAADLGNTLGRLFSMSADERTEMGANGRALIEDRFTWDKAANEMKSVYRWVTGQGPRPDCVDA